MEISDNNFNTSIFFDTNELGFKQITPAYLIKIHPSFYDNQYNLKVNSDGVIVNDLYVSSITNASNNGKHLTISNNGKIQVGNLGNGLEIDSGGNLNAKPLGGITVGNGLNLDLTTGILQADELGAATVGDGLEIVNGVLKAKSLGTATVGSNLHLDSTTNVIDICQIVLDNINLKAPINNPTFTGTVGGITKTMVGLGNVDNTSDADKPVSTATTTELALKAPLTDPTFTGTVSGIDKTMVGLGNVDNTSDTDKPVSTATQNALNTKQNNIADGDLTISNTTGLQTELDSKVGLSGDETISGSKTFSSDIVGDITGNAATSTTTSKLRVNGNDLNLPSNTGSEGQVLKLNDTGNLEWAVNEDAIDKNNDIEVKNLNVYGTADVSGSLHVLDEVLLEKDVKCKKDITIEGSINTNAFNINGVVVTNTADKLVFDKALANNINVDNLNVAYNTDISNLTVDYINFGNTRDHCKPSGTIITESGVTIKFI